MDENNKTTKKIENCGSSENPQDIFLDKTICSKRCSICSSDILKDIHNLRKGGMRFNDIVIHAKEKHSVKISTSSLCRHFKSYDLMKLNLSTKIIRDETLKEITSQSVHLQKTVELLDLAYDQILDRIKKNTYRVDISDLEKLAKMRYQILNGENPDDKDMAAIFSKASNKYGLELQQAFVFNKKS